MIKEFDPFVPLIDVDIATFDDAVANAPLVKFIGDVSPVQDLHGQVSPYPPNGGKNKLDITDGMATVGGITFTNNNGVISYSGTPSANSTYKSLNLNMTNLVAGTSYRLVANSTNSRIRLREFNGNTVTYEHYSNDGAFTLDASTTKCDVYLIVSGTAGTALSGTASPIVCLASESDTSFAPYSNICPISGYTEMNITRVGVNLIGKAGGYDGTTGVYDPTGKAICSDIIKVNEGDTFIASKKSSFNATWSHLYVLKFDSSKNYISQDRILLYNQTEGSPYSVPSGVGFVAFSVYVNDTDYLNISTFETQVEVGSAVSPYEAYNPEVYNISWSDDAGTVYYGTLEYLGNGEWKLTNLGAEKTYNSSTGWTYRTEPTAPSGTFSTTDVPLYFHSGATNVISVAAISNISECYDMTGGYSTAKNNAVSVLSNTDGTDIIYFRPLNGTLTSLAEFNTFLSANPLQVVFKLATPIEYTLTGPDPETLPGVNNWWIDTGKINSLYYPIDISYFRRYFMINSGYILLDGGNIDLSSSDSQLITGSWNRIVTAMKTGKPIWAYNTKYGTGKPLSPVPVFAWYLSATAIVIVGATLHIIVTNDDYCVVQDVASD